MAGTVFFAVHLWWHDSKRKRQQGDPLTEAYVEAAHAYIAGPAGWNDMLRQRVLCTCHRDSWRMENATICLGCLRYMCYQVGRRCSCGGHVVG
ncbi:hypothetical protein [Kitasatospora nipponensis]|uniref:hypothetical protein n=1 Tax=Kitasatospora nipponensis TaxID=258049 RepID=UPI0031DC4CC3